MTVFDSLATSAKDGLSEYSSAYLEHLRAVLTMQVDTALLRSRFRHRVGSDNGDVIRFSAVFNDVSFVEAFSPDQMTISTVTKDGFAKYFGVTSISVTMPQPTAEKLGFQGKSEAPMLPGFIFPSGEQGAKFLADVEPLIERGRVVVAPRRILIVPTGKTGADQPKWHTYSADPDSSFGAWVVTEESRPEDRPFQIVAEGEPGRPSERVMFEMLVPYLRGVSFRDLAKILEDESDLVAGLRASIRDVVSKAAPDQTAGELARDVIDPKIALLNRRFRTLVETHALRIGGASVGTIALAFTAATTGGVGAALITIAGAGGVGLLTKQIADYRGERSALTEDPYYFLWRCRKRAKGT